MHAIRSPWLLAVSTLVVLAGCGGDSDAGGDEMIAAFYPLQFVAERVAGDTRPVRNLTPAGAEPHDLEISARDTAAVHDAGLVVLLGGFTPALDAAVEDLPAERVLDVAAAANLTGHTEDAHADDDHSDDEHSDDEHSDDEHTDDAHADDAHDGRDPHFWLDPLRLAAVATELADRLAADDPERADGYTERAAELVVELEALDSEFAAGLADCEVTSLVTSHTAFGYLAERYGLAQIGIAGLSPDAEPTPAKLAEVTDFVNEHGVSTIYYETLVDPAVAETVATETGAATAVLDPLEGLAAGAADADYFTVMRANLDTLRTGQRCR